MRLLPLFVACAFRLPSVSARPQDEVYEEIGLRIHNLHDHDLYISGDWAAKDVAAYGFEALSTLDYQMTGHSTLFIPALRDTSPKFFFGLTPNSATYEVGSKRDHDTVVEATFFNKESKTYYDVDVERGMSVPVWCHGQYEAWHEGKGCEGDVTGDCPEHLVHYDVDGTTVDQCWGEDTETDISRRRQFCRQAYVVWNDDQKGTKGTHRNEGNIITCWILDPKNETRTGIEDPDSGA